MPLPIPPPIAAIPKVLPKVIAKPIPRLVIGGLGLVTAAAIAGISFITIGQVPIGAACGLPAAAFCDTFDTAKNGATRSGDLDPVIWGVSRASGHVSIGQWDNAWFPTDVDACGTIVPQQLAPHDVVICNGQLREATNDGHQVTTLAMYPKQPFDFAGRTGKVVFDVSNDTLNTHDAWPEFWLSDKPVPTPFNHFDSWQALPQHGFGVRMASGALPGQFGFCPNGNNLDKQRWTVDSAVVVRNWIMDDTAGYGTRTAMSLKVLDCVVAPSGPNGGLNHVELWISQNQIDVYATDAGTTSPLKHLAVITNANLSLTRGLIWLEDVHYNASKATADENGPHTQHTFAWDNVGFDGPVTYHDLSYDALDALFPPLGIKNFDGSYDLGKVAQANGTSSWDVLGMPANPTAESVRVLFNFFDYTNPTTLNVTVNGHPHSVPWPYPDTLSFTWRTIAVNIPITDLVSGTNAVLIGGNQTLLVSNVNIVLVNVGASPPATTVPATAVPATAIPTVAPATAVPATAVPATAVPATAVPTAIPNATSTPSSTAVPTSTAAAATCRVSVELNGTPGPYRDC